MQFLVMGAGALGGYVGGRLVQAGYDVSFVARGAHLNAMQQSGLQIDSPAGDVHIRQVNAVDAPSKAPSADIVFLLVKSFDVVSAAEALLPTLKPNSVVVTFQNGVTAPQRLGEIVGHERVVPGVAYLPAEVTAPGVVRHNAELQRLIIGPGATGASNHLKSALCATGIDAQISDQIEVTLWTKFVFFSALSALTALTRLDIGPLRKTQATADLFRRAMNETEAVGQIVCPALPKGTADGQWDFMLSLPDTVHASTLDDLLNGKRLEVDYLSGDVSRLGRKHGIATPVHDFAWAALQPYVDGTPS